MLGRTGNISPEIMSVPGNENDENNTNEDLSNEKNWRVQWNTQK